MPTFAIFRFSTFLTLAVAFVTLAYAEWVFVPEGTVIMMLMTGLLVVLYLYEDRLPLSLRAANRVGVVLGLATMSWLGWQLAHTGTGLLENLPWSVRIMPYIGPVLAVLLPAKILRPNKHVGDYWTLHAAALCLVALATAMAEDTLFFGLVFMYLVCFVWSLLLFGLMRSSGQVAPLPSRVPIPGPVTAMAPEPPHPRRKEFALVFATLLTAIALAVPFFLVTPRTGGPVWDLAGRRFQVGFAADQLLDLNRTGTLHVNTETAFEVEIRDAETGNPVTAIPPEIHWRSLDGTYTVYTNGVWRRDQSAVNPFGSRRRLFGIPTAPGPWTPPSFGPGTLRISYSVPNRLRSLFLVDPFQWELDGVSPVASIDPDGALPWTIRSDGQVLPMLPARAQRFNTAYVQVVRPDSANTMGPPIEPVWKAPAPLIPFDKGPHRENPEEFEKSLRNNPVPAVKNYTDNVMERLIALRLLPAAIRQDRDPTTGLPHERHHAMIARALRDHLKSTGLFTYSLRLRRQDPRMDPTEDFLKNTREGHCERFATALVLMMRSQGIPSQFVLGFKGCEFVEDAKYVVRHDHAHAWAEALIPVEGDRTGKLYRWLSLDPTPGFEDMNATETGNWWEQTWSRGREFLADYVVGYDTSAREKVMAILEESTSWPEITAAVTGAIALLVLVRYGRRLRRNHRQRTAADWKASYSLLLRALDPLGLKPEPGQTPLEFAAIAEARLRNSPRTQPLAHVPREWVEAHYASRFGEHVLPPERAAALDRALNDLRHATRQGG